MGQSSTVISRNFELDLIRADIQVNESENLEGQSVSAYFLIFRVFGDNKFADGISYITDASMSFTQLFLNPRRVIESGRLSRVRGSAAYNALSNGDYDVLVHPNYTTTVENYLIYKKYTVSVTGYGAKYKNFRTERQKVVLIQEGQELILQDR